MMVASTSVPCLLHHDIRVTEPLLDGVEELACQSVLLQQMPEIHDGSTVRDGLVQGEFGKQMHRRVHLP